MTSEKNKQIWLETAYEVFAKEGPNGLKIEALARAVKKSKSSFYHYFADLEYFTEQLLAYHVKRGKIVADRESKCKTVDPELLEVLVEFKTDLLFNRQLRIHRQVPEYEACFQKTSQEVGIAVLPIWSDFLGLPNQSHLAMMVLSLSMENFFLQITEETLEVNWLRNYVAKLQQMVRAFKQA